MATNAKIQTLHNDDGTYIYPRTTVSALVDNNGKKVNILYTDENNKVPTDMVPSHASTHTSSGSDPITPDDIGAVKKTGDTMSGNLTIEKNNPLITGIDNNTESEMRVLNTDNTVSIQNLNVKSDVTTRRGLNLYNSNHDTFSDLSNSLILYDCIDDNSNGYKIYGEHNKPTPVDIGAQATITGGATTITSSNLTASRALVSDANGKVAVSAVTSTELGYLDGVTSAIQTQLNGKAPTSHASSDTTYGVGTTSNYGHVKVTAGNGLSISSGAIAMAAASASAAGAITTGAQTIAGDKTFTGTLVLSKTTDMSGIADNGPALVIGGTRTSAHIEIDNNEIQAKSNGTTVTGININTDGGAITLGTGGTTSNGNFTMNTGKYIYGKAYASATATAVSSLIIAKMNAGTASSAAGNLELGNTSILTNLKGSSVTITGNTTHTGHIYMNGSRYIYGKSYTASSSTLGNYIIASMSPGTASSAPGTVTIGNATTYTAIAGATIAVNAHTYLAQSKYIYGKAYNSDTATAVSNVQVLAVAPGTSGSARGTITLGNTATKTSVLGSSVSTSTLYPAEPAIGTAAARRIYAGTGAMTAGTTALTTGRIYLQYE